MGDNSYVSHIDTLYTLQQTCLPSSSPAKAKKEINMSKVYFLTFRQSSTHLISQGSRVVVCTYAIVKYIVICLFVLLLYILSQQLWPWWDGQFTKPHYFFWASFGKRLTSTLCIYFRLELTTLLECFSGREENDPRNYFVFNLHESIGPGQDQACDPWISSQKRMCSQARYQLRYAAKSVVINMFHINHAIVLFLGGFAYDFVGLGCHKQIVDKV